MLFRSTSRGASHGRPGALVTGPQPHCPRPLAQRRPTPLRAPHTATPGQEAFLLRRQGKPVEFREAPPNSTVSLISQRHPEKLPEFTSPSRGCPTLCNPIDSSPPGSPIPGILQEPRWLPDPLVWVPRSQAQGRAFPPCVCGVTQSRARLKRLSSSSSSAF